MTDDVSELYRRLLDSWNDRDGDAMAAIFVEDGEMIGFDGSNVLGRTAIATEMKGIFSNHETAAFVGKVKSVREPSSGVALLRAIAGMVPPGGSDLNPEVNTHHTIVAERVDGEWQIALFQNTPAQFHGRPGLSERFTEELRELL